MTVQAIRTFGIAIALLTLSGCWSGRIWFTPRDAVAVMPEGRYSVADPNGSSDLGSDIVSIGTLADNSMMLDGVGEPWRLIVVPFGASHPEKFIVQGYDAQAERPDGAAYLLLDTRAGRYRLSVMPCDYSIRELVERTGGSWHSDPQTGAGCFFSDKGAFRKAVEDFVRKHPDKFDFELVKLP